MPRYSLTNRVNFAKKYGLRIEIVPGAETRGSDSYNPQCYVGHHTAGPKTGDRPSLNVCVNGREDLAGPLCEDFLPRMGGLVIVACGRSNNAGLGGFRGITGNSGTAACEAEDDGDGLWTPEQWRDYPRVVASSLDMLGLDETWYCSHRTWALTPPSWSGRKIDPTGVSDEWMRAWVHVLHRNPKAVPRQGMPTAADLEGAIVPVLDNEDKKWISAEIERVGLRVEMTGLTGTANSVVSSEDAAGFAPVSLASFREQFTTFAAASTTREQALVVAVSKLAESSGVQLSKEEIVATLDAAVERGFGDLDLRIVPGPAQP